ncbi:MAG: type II toxin-antitoxin system RelE/ParE family toxin [Solirubrobacteraceae bacterium]
MTDVGLSPEAVEDLDRLIITHSLPADTRPRVKRSLGTLERFPRIGRELDEPWSPLRSTLGPWRWLLIVYTYGEQEDSVVVLSFQDARSSHAVTSLASP